MAEEKVSVPVIDFADFPSELKSLAAACTGLGCFRVVNHSIPAADTWRPLPRILDAASASDVRMEAYPFCRETISSYASKLHVLIVNIANRVAESLGVVNYSFQDWPCQFRINKYNFTKETVGLPGVQIHTDSGFLTVLQEDESVGGLEIMHSSRDFVAIDPVPDTFLVNLGDVAKAWSNGRLHCKESLPRISIALFMLAPKDDEVEPQQELIDSEHPRLFKSFLYEEYRKLRFSSGAKDGRTLYLLLAADQTAVKSLVI